MRISSYKRSKPGKSSRKTQAVKGHTKGRQTGKSNTKADKQRTAKAPGQRTSKSGRNYTERRRNRSDVSRKTRL